MTSGELTILISIVLGFIILLASHLSAHKKAKKVFCTLDTTCTELLAIHASVRKHEEHINTLSNELKAHQDELARLK